MLGFTTTINLKTREIKTTFAFGKGVRTFAFEYVAPGSRPTVSLGDALKVAAEDMANQVHERLAEIEFLYSELRPAAPPLSEEDDANRTL
jgi:hypothetical protein